VAGLPELGRGAALLQHRIGEEEPGRFHVGDEERVPVAKRDIAGEIFKQADLAATLRKLVETEQQALKAGKSRKDAIYAAYDRFYKGDIAREFVKGSQELGPPHARDLASWKVHVERPSSPATRHQVY
jgi:gamma-glutamyltranspeptidase/glutathione hydrolase